MALLLFASIVLTMTALWLAGMKLLFEWVDPYVERWHRRRIWRRCGGEGEPPAREEDEDGWPLR